MRSGSQVFALAILTLVAGWGCGKSSPALVTTVPVKGKITHKGKPLTKGTIVFEPTDRGKEAFGPIQPDGTFVLTTYTDNDGAVAGTHRVYVAAPPKPGFPLKYTQPSSSRVEVEVSASTTVYAIDFK